MRVITISCEMKRNEQIVTCTSGQLNKQKTLRRYGMYLVQLRLSNVLSQIKEVSR